jgi:hypothetical protein
MVDEKQVDVDDAPAVVFSVMLTETRVNCGDHAQDIVKALDVPESMTIGELVRERLQQCDWRGEPMSDEASAENYITIRLAANVFKEVL